MHKNAIVKNGKLMSLSYTGIFIFSQRQTRMKHAMILRKRHEVTILTISVETSITRFIGDKFTCAGLTFCIKETPKRVLGQTMMTQMKS